MTLPGSIQLQASLPAADFVPGKILLTFDHSPVVSCTAVTNCRGGSFPARVPYVACPRAALDRICWPQFCGSKGLRYAQADSFALSRSLRRRLTAEGGGRELAPLDGSQRAQGPVQEPSRGTVVTASVVGRLTSQARELLALQGRDMCSTPAARLRPTV